MAFPPNGAPIWAFLRPTAWVLWAFAGWLALRTIAGSDSRSTEPELLRHGILAPEQLSQVGADRVVLPSPEVEPAEVVRLQLAGLADSQPHGVGILQCYCFASPANRAITGPLDRFGQMVRQEPFAVLGGAEAALVGAPQMAGPLAKVLVTAVDRHRRIWAFSFILSRQLAGPFKDCWMTEGVLPLGAAEAPTGRMPQNGADQTGA